MGTRSAALLLLGSFWVAPLAAPATLKIATLAPDGTTWMREMRAGADRLERRSHGRVSLKFYPGGVMGNDASVLRKIRFGQLHGGAFTGGSLAAVHPDAQLYSLPMLFRSYAEVDYVRARMDDLIREALAGAGLAVLGISDGGFAYVMSSRSFAGIEDLKRHKVWIPEGDLISRSTLETAGVSAVPLPLADVYTGLQTGLLETITSVPTGAIALHWHTRIRHVADLPLLFLTGILAVDAKAFAELAADDQQLAREVFAEVFQRLDELNRQENEQARVAMQEQGIRFERPSAAEWANWEGIAAATIAGLAGKGAYSEPLLETLRTHLAEFRARQRLDGG